MRRISENVLDVLETREGQNIFSVKWQKRLILMNAELKQKVQGQWKFVRTTGTLWHEVHMEGLQQKKEGICKIYYLWVTLITPDIRQIWQEKPNGKLKMVLFHIKKWSIQIRSQHSPKLRYKPEMGGNKPLFWQNYIQILSFRHVTPRMYRQRC